MNSSLLEEQTDEDGDEEVLYSAGFQRETHPVQYYIPLFMLQTMRLNPELSRRLEYNFSLVHEFLKQRDNSGELLRRMENLSRNRIPSSKQESEQVHSDLAEVFVFVLANEQAYDNAIKLTTHIFFYLISMYLTTGEHTWIKSHRRMHFEDLSNMFCVCLKRTLQNNRVKSREADFTVKVVALVLVMYLGKCSISPLPTKHNEEDLKHSVVVPLLAFQTLKSGLLVRREARSQIRFVHEEVRRSIFQLAIETKQWKEAELFADYSLYDDQRYWAVNRTLKEEQWELALTLSEYGMDEQDRFTFHSKVVLNAPWSFVKTLLAKASLLERKAKSTLAEIALSDILQRARSMKRRLDTSTWPWYDQEKEKNRHKEVEMETRIQKIHQFCEKVSCRPSYLHECFPPSDLKKAKRNRSRLRESHSPDGQCDLAVRQRLWGTVRQMLEQGQVSIEKCLHLLPKFVEDRRWLLVARIMNYPLENPVGDDIRKEVMSKALECQEGSVVAHCIRMMETPLSGDPKMRKHVFRTALRHRIWQALKPLVEERDQLGIHFRDSVLEDAADSLQWDSVEHCLVRGAEIDKRRPGGQTLLNKAAHNKDWKAVVKLVMYGADQYVLGSDEQTVLQKIVDDVPQLRSVEDQQNLARFVFSDNRVNTADLLTVMRMVEFHGDLTKTGQQGHVPLDKILRVVDRSSQDISTLKLRHNCCDILHETLFWGGDVARYVSSDLGLTPLHAICQSGAVNYFYHMFARCPSLTLSQFGESVFLSAAKSDTCAEMLVMECIKMGMPSLQPRVSDDWNEVRRASPNTVVPQAIRRTSARVEYQAIRSPFEFSLFKSNVGLMRLIYDCGGCSIKEPMFLLNLFLSGPSIEHRGTGAIPSLAETCREVLTRHEDSCKPLICLRQLVRTPRTLASACRLVIKAKISMCKNHTRHIYYLPIVTCTCEDYLRFENWKSCYFPGKPFNASCSVKSLPPLREHPELECDSILLGGRRLGRRH